MRFCKNLVLTLILTACAADARQATSAPSPKVTSEPLAAQTETENSNPAEAQSFGQWKHDFAVRAVQSGISQSTVNAALEHIQLNKKVISLDKKQPEKKLTKEEYLANVINQGRIDKGRKMMAENRALLADISRQTGVEPEFIVALWGLESGFGENKGNYSVINSLATLAYEGRRREFFENELLSALLIVDSRKASLSDLRGSWAGAMGGCQFMPSSLLAYGVDFDSDGHIDIWNNRADTLASIANYLATVGWGKDDAIKTKTLMHWNKSSYFVASVFELAEAIK